MNLPQLTCTNLGRKKTGTCSANIIQTSRQYCFLKLSLSKQVHYRSRKVASTVVTLQR